MSEVIVREASELEWPPGRIPQVAEVDGIRYHYNHKATDNEGELMYVEYHSATSQHPSILRVFND